MTGENLFMNKFMESNLWKLQNADVERVRSTFLIPEEWNEKLGQMQQSTGLTKTLLVLLGLYLLAEVVKE